MVQKTVTTTYNVGLLTLVREDGRQGMPFYLTQRYTHGVGTENAVEFDGDSALALLYALADYYSMTVRPNALSESEG